MVGSGSDELPSITETPRAFFITAQLAVSSIDDKPEATGIPTVVAATPIPKASASPSLTSHSSNPAPIIGPVVGLVLMVLLGLAFFFVPRCRRRSRDRVDLLASESQPDIHGESPPWVYNQHGITADEVENGTTHESLVMSTPVWPQSPGIHGDSQQNTVQGGGETFSGQPVSTHVRITSAQASSTFSRNPSSHQDVDLIVARVLEALKAQGRTQPAMSQDSGAQRDVQTLHDSGENTRVDDLHRSQLSHSGSSVAPSEAPPTYEENGYTTLHTD